MAVNWQQLVEERNAWIAHNFPNPSVPDPGESVWGVFEEIGELTHAHLKQAQSIRGDDAKHVQDAQDAIGDATIYLLGVMNFSTHTPQPWSAEPSGSIHKAVRDGAAGGLLFALQDQAGGLSRSHLRGWGLTYFVDSLVALMRHYCKARDWDYDAIVQSTWDGVKQRDWIAYPDTGLPPAEYELKGGHEGTGTTPKPKPAFYVEVVQPVYTENPNLCPICGHAGGNPTPSGCEICD